jgi:hypothetical protein
MPFSLRPARGFRRAAEVKLIASGENRDDVAWSLNEYTKAMDKFKLKRSIGFMKTYLIPTAEALESFYVACNKPVIRLIRTSRSDSQRYQTTARHRASVASRRSPAASFPIKPSDQPGFARLHGAEAWMS